MAGMQCEMRGMKFVKKTHFLWKTCPEARLCGWDGNDLCCQQLLDSMA